MTRREELVKAAGKVWRDVVFDNSREPVRVIYDALLQVERECWEKAAKELEDVNFYAAAWCREQLKGVDG